MDYDAHKATALLAISQETLRDWNEQFAVLLSRTGKPGQANSRRAPRERYTEADISMLRQAKDMLGTGQTYDQVRLALTGERPAEKPKRSSRRTTRQNGTTPTLKPPESATGGLAVLHEANEQALAAKDLQILELEHMLHVALQNAKQEAMLANDQRVAEFEQLLEAQQRKNEQFAHEIEQLQAENQTLHEQLATAASAYTPSYAFQLKILVVMAIVAAVVTLLIEVAFNPSL
jgi:DNA-binding transcriptional MerR regulator